MQITDYVITPEELARRLVAVVDSAPLEGAGDKAWTETVKTGLVAILQTDGLEMLYTDPKRGISEFMLDFVAWNRKGGEGIALAAESEWGGVGRTALSYPEQVAFDFWKLLLVKSPVKLMVFASSIGVFPQELILEKLKEAFELYHHHTVGEEYVFIDFAPGDARKAFHVRVPATDDARVSFTPIPIALDPA